MPIWIALYQRTGRGLGPVIRVRFRCADACPMLALALSRCGLPLPWAPLPRAALNREGAAMWLLYSFRRLGTSGPAFAPVAVLLSHVPVFRQLTRFSSIVCLQRLAPGPTQFCKP